ncbi:MAG: PAS domain S-box protein [Betaproteobacteria bacterium]|nr:MAG: PAS domain S-box protein [Betaproteobacteria bacterium]
MGLTRSSDSNAARGLRLARRNYIVRAGAFAYCFLVAGLLGWERGFGLGFWAALVASFLALPHLQLARALRARDPREAEMQNIFVDAVLFGVWTAGLGFPTWVAYAGLSSVTLNAIIARGVRGALVSAALFGAGAALWVAAFGLHYWAPTSQLVSTLCFAGALGYTLSVGFVVHVQHDRLRAARAELRAGAARYRLITEHAADLIAMVNRDGRWLYTSPSHDNIFDGADLAVGADAFRRVHPDDAGKARAAVVRAAASGKDEELALRLHDRYGRIRQLRMRIHPVSQSGAPAQLLLVSQDETYKRESEEQLLLAGQALENMSEAIMIVTAEGLVQTVNRAFTQITGYSRGEVIGKPVVDLRSGLQPADFYEQMLATVAREGHWTGIKWNKRKSGAVYKEWRSVRAVRDAAGKITHYVTVFSEVAPTRP